MSTYLFEITNSNSVNNQEQNVTGKFGTGTGSTFEGAFCNAGTLCVANGNLPIEGYESIVDSNGNPKYLNGRSFYMNVAADGTGVNNYATKPTAGTGLYFEFSQMRPVTAGTFYEGDKYPLTARMI